MAKRPANKGKKCIRKHSVFSPVTHKKVMRCAKFGKK